jgi:F0F1-type ATP synthase delta subunit
MSKKQAKAWSYLNKAANNGLIKIWLDESTNNTNIIKVELLEFYKNGNFITKTEDKAELVRSIFGDIVTAKRLRSWIK